MLFCAYSTLIHDVESIQAPLRDRDDDARSVGSHLLPNDYERHAIDPSGDRPYERDFVGGGSADVAADRRECRSVERWTTADRGESTDAATGRVAGE